MAFRYEAKVIWRDTNSGGGISGWADKQTDRGGEAARCRFTNGRRRNQWHVRVSQHL